MRAELQPLGIAGKEVVSGTTYPPTLAVTNVVIGAIDCAGAPIATNTDGTVARVFLGRLNRRSSEDGAGRLEEVEATKLNEDGKRVLQWNQAAG